MLRLVLLCGFTLTVWTASVSLADDAPISDSVVRVYPVGDLVSVAATSGGKPGGDWETIAAETRQALAELGSIVESMLAQKPIAVRTYTPTLSLIVRHFPEGHEEIAHLLQSLGEADRCSIQVEFRPLNMQQADALPDAEESKAETLLMKHQLTTAQTTELLELLNPNDASVESVALKSGRRTSWGQAKNAPTAGQSGGDGGKRTLIATVYPTMKRAASQLPCCPHRYALRPVCSAPIACHSTWRRNTWAENPRRDDLRPTIDTAG
jgi:hypothetical protein